MQATESHTREGVGGNREVPPKVVDAVTFFNEEAVVRSRFAELGGVVDVFVVVEATRTHAGLPKVPCFPEDLKARHDVRYVLVEDLPPPEVAPDAWVRENAQRTAILRGLEGFADGDVVMIGDVDEIPRRAFVAGLKSPPTPALLAKFRRLGTNMRLFYFSFAQEKPIPWNGTVVTTVAAARAMGPQWMRDYRTLGPFFEGAGWHCTYFGGPDHVATKIRSFAHQEFNDPTFTDPARIAERIRDCRDAFDRPDASNGGGAIDRRGHVWDPSDLPRAARHLDPTIRLTTDPIRSDPFPSSAQPIRSDPSPPTDEGIRSDPFPSSAQPIRSDPIPLATDPFPHTDEGNRSVPILPPTDPIGVVVEVVEALDTAWATRATPLKTPTDYEGPD